VTWWQNIITGPDNVTVSIGRVMGIVVFAVFILAVPIFAIVSLKTGVITATDWGLIFDKLQVYLPAIILSVGGLIGLTYTSDPRGPKP
jgi:hypothetical protein